MKTIKSYSDFRLHEIITLDDIDYKVESIWYYTSGLTEYELSIKGE